MTDERAAITGEEDPIREGYRWSHLVNQSSIVFWARTLANHGPPLNSMPVGR